MLHAAFEALLALIQPTNLLWLMLGVLLGLAVGLIPGLGGTVGLALLLPVVYGMDPVPAVAMMIGLLAVNNTSDTFPAVLLGVPGSGGGASTIIDGHPLAKQGQAGRALGAAFTASMFGGIIGALVFFAIIPIARPLVLAAGSPEMFMLALFGLSMVGILSRGRSPIAGLLLGALGLLVSTIGSAPASPEYRFTFGLQYLSDGFSLVIVVMGLFAVPELIELVRKDQTISELGAALKGSRFEGAIDAMRHKWLVVRSSIIGVVLGAIPGVGGSATTWIMYGITSQSYRDKSKFGKGDIRGVIGPEAANNSNDAGSLIPTLLFGVPAGASMAVLLGGLVLLGVQPGPQLIEEQLPLLMTVAWSLALANILGTAICFSLRNRIAKLTTIRAGRLAPFLFVAIMIGAYQSTINVGDLVLLLVIGVFGWAVMRAGWSRAPFLIGFVLGPITERYLWISVSNFGPGFVLRPGVIIIGLLIIGVLALAFVRPKGLHTLQDPTVDAVEAPIRRLSLRLFRRSGSGDRAIVEPASDRDDRVAEAPESTAGRTGAE
jgi:putative tricarboxylic transport membrane protein